MLPLIFLLLLQKKIRVKKIKTALEGLTGLSDPVSALTSKR